jgi:hypothetical protein
MQRREVNGYRIPDPTVERIITKNGPDIQSFASEDKGDEGRRDAGIRKGPIQT